MSKIKTFMEFVSEKGVYVAVDYTRESSNRFINHFKAQGIPNLVRADKLHTTVIYSRKPFNFDEYKGNTSRPLDLVFTEFKPHVFETQSGKRALVMLIEDADELTDRHNHIMTKYDASYDFPDYIPHCTVSYDIGELDISKIIEYTGTLHTSNEYVEPLDVDWA